MKRWLLPVALAAGFPNAEPQATGETPVSLLRVEQDDFTDEMKYADLFLIANDDGGSLLWACWHDYPTSGFSITVNDRRRSGIREAGDAESVRFRVDRHPMWTETMEVYDGPDDEAARTHTGDFTATRRFVDEVSAGERLIAQVANLSTLSFDLTTAQRNIVDFVKACESMHDDIWKPEGSPPVDESQMKMEPG